MGDNKSASEQELLDAIKDLLDKGQHLNKLQAEIRAKVTEVLRERHAALAGNKKNDPPEPTGDVLIINELIREYLEWNGYLYTASVMSSEAALPTEKKSRLDLCAEVGVKDDERSSALPLLANIITAYTDRIRRKITKTKKEISG